MKNKRIVTMAIPLIAILAACTIVIVIDDMDDSDAAISETYYHKVGDNIATLIINGPYGMTWSGSIPGIVIVNADSGTIGHLHVSGTFAKAGTYIITAQNGSTAIFVISDDPKDSKTITRTYAQNENVSDAVCIGYHNLTWTGTVPGITFTMDNNYSSGLGALTYNGIVTTVGSYTITVSNGDRVIIIIKEPVNVNNIPPIASFTYHIDGFKVSFTDTSMVPTTWKWSFGDTTTSVLQNPDHTYDKEGTYEVTLTVTNATTISDTYRSTITVGMDESKIYTITFNANGGSGNIDQMKVMTGNAITLPVSGMTKSGYYLSGWSMKSTSGTHLNAGSKLTPTNDMILYAIWTKYTTFVDPDAITVGYVNKEYSYKPQATSSFWKIYSATFSELGTNEREVVKDSMPSWLSISNEPLPRFFGTPTTPGVYYIQIHMSCINSQLNGYTYVSFAITVSDPSDTTYTLKYSPGTGTGSLDDRIGMNGTVIRLESSGMTKEGYTLAGWWISVNGTSVVYPLGSIYTIKHDTIAAACWVPNSNIIVIDANGGIIHGSTFKAYIAATNGTVTFPSDGLTRSGFVLAGWYNSADPSSIYSLGYIYTVSASETFCAYWIESGTAVVNVTFNANGGVGGFTQSVESGKKIVIPSYGVTWNGHQLSGWCENSLSGTNYQLGTKIVIFFAKTFYAIWIDSTNAVTVTFDLAGGVGSTSIQTFISGGKATMPTSPTREGYLFAGWKILGGASNNDFNTIVTSSITLVAQWDKFFTLTTDKLTVIVTLEKYKSSPTTITWWDGTTSEGHSGIFRHSFESASSGIVTVSTMINDQSVSSSMGASVTSSENHGGHDDDDGMMECPFCHNQIPKTDGAFFCPLCGKKINGLDSNSESMDWILIGLGIALILGCILLFFVYRIAIIPYTIMMAIVIAWRLLC